MYRWNEHQDTPRAGPTLTGAGAGPSNFIYEVVRALSPKAGMTGLGVGIPLSPHTPKQFSPHHGDLLSQLSPNHLNVGYAFLARPPVKSKKWGHLGGSGG